MITRKAMQIEAAAVLVILNGATMTTMFVCLITLSATNHQTKNKSTPGTTQTNRLDEVGRPTSMDIGEEETNNDVQSQWIMYPSSVYV